MIQNRELTMDDYLAMLRRRAKVILIPALIAPLVGFLISYAFTPKYTSQSEVLVEPPKISDAVVQQVFTQDLTQHITTIGQRVLSPARLQPVVERLGLAKAGHVDEVVSDIQVNTSLEPVPDISQFGSTVRKKPGQSAPVPGFYVRYTGSTANEARKVCDELTSMLLDEDLKSRQDATKGTTDFIVAQVAEAKRTLDDLDAKLADFKKHNGGQLPGDQENNLKILGGLNSQLEANTQTLGRAQQDKAYTESMLAQQLAAWQSTQSSTNPQTLEKQLSDLQSALLGLQARYTDDHPDVIKTKADIAEVKKKLAEINKASSEATDTGSDKASAMEPPEIRQLRLQVHQYSDLILAATRDQKRLQQEITTYQGRVTLSPTVEEEYSKLMRDYANAQKVYQDDLSKQGTSSMASQAASQAQGEQMALLNPANLPDSPSFPNRLLFAAGGLAAGLALGGGLAMWLELRDNSIRTEADAEAALELPMLVSVPWVGVPVAENKNGKFKFWNRNKHPDEHHKETVGV